MSAPSLLLVTGSLCGAALLVSGLFLIRLARQRHAIRKLRDAATARRAARTNHRRTLGSALMALIAAAFFLGVNFVDPWRGPTAFVWLWIIILLLVLWLVVLALIDLRQIIKDRQRWHALAEQELQRAILRYADRQERK